MGKVAKGKNLGDGNRQIGLDGRALNLMRPQINSKPKSNWINYELTMNHMI